MTDIDYQKKIYEELRRQRFHGNDSDEIGQCPLTGILGMCLYLYFIYHLIVFAYF